MPTKKNHNLKYFFRIFKIITPNKTIANVLYIAVPDPIVITVMLNSSRSISLAQIKHKIDNVNNKAENIFFIFIKFE